MGRGPDKKPRPPRTMPKHRPWGGTQRFQRLLIKRWKQSKGCSHCGQKLHYCQLQLDHIIPHTDANRSAIRGDGQMATIKEELSKCQVLCANCHAYKTWSNKEHNK